MYMKFCGKTATAIIPYQGNKILLIKRLTPPFINFWALPGGRCEPNETTDLTVIREVKEETGLDVEIINKVGEYHESGNQGGFDYDYYPDCYVVKPIGGKIKRQDTEISEINLFDLDKIPNLAFEHTGMVKDYLRRIKQVK